MGFFDDGERVSKDEFKRALWKLRDKGLSHAEIDEVEKAFQGDIYEGGVSAGISKEEIKFTVRRLKDHHGGLALSREHIHKVEDVLKHYL
ncbi:MAG: hypothetical protein NUV54_01250 [Candidatus Taylorbacteria bacterium]|nr:hypothetical protein [Candidatus Taylorbacteria bacterium]